MQKNRWLVGCAQTGCLGYWQAAKKTSNLALTFIKPHVVGKCKYLAVRDVRLTDLQDVLFYCVAKESDVSTDEAKKYWIGFDLGGTKMQCTLYDEELKAVADRRKRTKGEQGVETGLQRIESTISKLLQETEISVEQLVGIGIGCPGPVEWEKGIVRVAVNLGWENVAVGSFLEDQFQCPVAVLNDVDAGVYGEHIGGAGCDARTTFGLFPGTGIGGGCVYDGQILRGKALSAMEFGHIKISASVREGATGMTGTLESEASRLSIAGELTKLSYRGEAPHLNSLVGTELGAIRSKVIAESIAQGDKAVKQVVVKACEQLGYAVSKAGLMLCPDCVVLGGGLVEAMPELFVDEVSRVAREHVFECYRDEFVVKAAELGDDAATLGAAAWIQKLCNGTEG
ncbi:MAG: ROK family protein [Planctomycetota bacterium]|nr:ROK family protein [Planctomycetota bacterium]